MRKRAVVVGVNDYSVQGAGNLRYCVRDAQAFYHLLADAFGFAAEDIYFYTDRTATSANIRRAIRYILNAGEAGDVACFYFAGHGTRIQHPARPGEFYECIIPYSGQFITDHELYQAAERLEPSVVNFTIVLDSCHSGGMHDETEQIRIRSPRTTQSAIDRILEALETLIPCGLCLAPADREILKNNITGKSAGTAGVVDLDEDPNRLLVQQAKSTLIAACRANETAKENTSLAHGLLTQSFLDIVNASNFQTDHRSLQEDLLASVGAYIRRFGISSAQTPQLRGQENRMEESFLAGWIDSR